MGVLYHSLPYSFETGYLTEPGVTDSAKLVGPHGHREQATTQPLPVASSSAPPSRLLPLMLLMMACDVEL